MTGGVRFNQFHCNAVIILWIDKSLVAIWPIQINLVLEERHIGRLHLFDAFADICTLEAQMFQPLTALVKNWKIRFSGFVLLEMVSQR